jgi:signal peptidase I
VRRVLVVAALTLAGAVVLAVVALVVLVATETVKLYAIPTAAMERTLRCARPTPGCTGDVNDRVLALTRFTSYDRGDIVVFPPSREAAEMCGISGTYVKRVIGLPGETVEVRGIEGRGYVFVDGRRLEEPYVDDVRRDLEREVRTRVPDDHLFVLGDDRARSCDSVDYGPIAEADVRGEAVAIFWPPDRISFP